MTITKCRGLFALIRAGNPFLWKREAKQQSPAVAKKKYQIKDDNNNQMYKLIESDQKCFCHSTPYWREFNGFKLDVNYLFYYYYFNTPYLNISDSQRLRSQAASIIRVDPETLNGL